LRGAIEGLGEAVRDQCCTFPAESLYPKLVSRQLESCLVNVLKSKGAPLAEAINREICAGDQEVAKLLSEVVAASLQQAFAKDLPAIVEGLRVKSGLSAADVFKSIKERGI